MKNLSKLFFFRNRYTDMILGILWIYIGTDFGNILDSWKTSGIPGKIFCIGFIIFGLALLTCAIFNIYPTNRFKNKNQPE